MILIPSNRRASTLRLTHSPTSRLGCNELNEVKFALRQITL